jgi:hypothetical protein
VTLDLTNSVVDTKGLGLRNSTFQVASMVGTDISAGSLTSVASIVSDGSNHGADTGIAKFDLSGPSFANVSVSVDLTGAADTTAVVNKINDAIKLASNAGTPAANALRSAAVTASVVTDTNGAQRLAFNSTTAAFQVGAGNRLPMPCSAISKLPDNPRVRRCCLRLPAGRFRPRPQATPSNSV